MGTTKKISAAIIFDELLASDIRKKVEFNHTSALNFNLNNKNIESGQKHMVIPLFDDAHKALDKDQYIR
ncbi:DUF4842 domain-containing protein [Bacteroides sp.]|uniref:DUF4842 domain-containing protein n=1 Tax=Bacteroides sp. TaxID=29523 RepID=UPI00345DA300